MTKDRESQAIQVVAGDFGDDNIDEIDEEWAEFEKVLRYDNENKSSKNQ